MRRVRKKTVLALAIFIASTSTSFADESVSFKGIKFGMSAREIAELAGGDGSKCAKAIPRTWTYGGQSEWRAYCEDDIVHPGRELPYTGLYRLESSSLRVSSVDDLVEVFSVAFGEFDEVTDESVHAKGRYFDGRRAIRRHPDAEIVMENYISGSWVGVTITITSNEYIEKIREMENEKKRADLDRKSADF